MDAIGGVGLIAIAAVLLAVGRPRWGAPAPFLRVWIVGQLYVLVTMLIAVLGITAIIINRPF